MNDPQVMAALIRAAEGLLLLDSTRLDGNAREARCAACRFLCGLWRASGSGSATVAASPDPPVTAEARP